MMSIDAIMLFVYIFEIKADSFLVVWGCASDEGDDGVFECVISFNGWVGLRPADLRG